MSRYDDFESKVGESEDHFCGRCNETRPHIWKKQPRTVGIWPASSTYYDFYLKCKYCGDQDMIYTTE